jgi:hypothetical protein
MTAAIAQIIDSIELDISTTTFTPAQFEGLCLANPDLRLWQIFVVLRSLL